MNVLYLIGNGFDLNLGLPTSYKDFLEYYKTAKISSNALKDIPKENRKKRGLDLRKIKMHFFRWHSKRKKDPKFGHNWMDLELALGDFSIEFTNLQDPDLLFQMFITDIHTSLVDYLFDIQGRYSIQEINNLGYLHSILANPIQTLHTDLDKKLYEDSIDGRIYEVWDIDIMTFNYTSFLESILRLYKKYEHYRGNGTRYYINQVKYIHGRLHREEISDTNILLGVDSIGQIANKKFRRNQSITDIFVKPQGNRILSISELEQCKSLINSADLICVFGCSLGKTDKYWWNLIKERIVQGAILFFYSKEAQGLSLGTQFRTKQIEICGQVMSALGIKRNKKKYEQRIYVIPSSKLFDSEEFDHIRNKNRNLTEELNSQRKSKKKVESESNESSD